jgi:uncharacterized protein YydD (DUF2326 family)
MIRLKKLYSEPISFDPIIFESGINIILGEKSIGNDKTNGVGKTMSIEFLNFCLLKRANESRVTLIPENIIDAETVVVLDLLINDQPITIKRSIKTPDIISIFKDGTEVIANDTIDIVSDYLGNLYFEQFPAHITRLSFRNLLNPILRDERSEFKDIVQCFDTKKRIPNDYKPHLFFLEFNIDLYSEIKKVIKRFDDKSTYFNETRKTIEKNYEKVSVAKQKLNDLDGEVYKINHSIERLKTNDSFQSILDELVLIESQLTSLRTKQRALKYEIKRINNFPEPENISESDMSILFNKFKDGLGDMVAKSLEEVKEFKSKIDSFRNTLVNSKLEKLKSNLHTINAKIQKLDDDYADRLNLLDNNGELLNDLKNSIKIFNKKNEELNSLRSIIERYEDADREKKSLRLKKENMINDFDEHIDNKASDIKEFEKTILWIHEKIMGNRNASFSIKTKNSSRSKEFLSFEYRIHDDGSWSTERMKVFLYDLALLLNNSTRKYHPRLLVHDNLFNVDNDSLEKSLNFLHSQAENHPEEFQYILTLNRDMVESMEEKGKLDFDIQMYKKASYTKKNRFLKKPYSELSRKNT